MVGENGSIPMRTRANTVAWLAAIVGVAAIFSGALKAAETGEPMMYLTVKDYEAGVSYRDLQRHAPLGIVNNPCSYADKLEPTIDWNDGHGPHKPDTNYITTMFQRTQPVIQGGVYLFWDDLHVAPAPGTGVVITKLVAHCVGDPPGDRVFVTKNAIHSYTRVPVQSVKFQVNGADVSHVKGHDLVDVNVVLSAPAPESGTWVHLAVRPQSALNSLPPFYFLPPGETTATIARMETRKPDGGKAELVVTAYTVGDRKQSQPLEVTFP
jgi:hypothetical protein